MPARPYPTLAQAARRAGLRPYVLDLFGDADTRALLEGIDFADVCITSDLTLGTGEAPVEAFRLDEVSGVAVVPALAEGGKCARCWKILPDVGTHASADTCGRCDTALHADPVA